MFLYRDGTSVPVIRYVLALALAATVLGMGAAAVEHAAGVRGEQTVETEVATLEDAAVALVESEEPDPTVDGPRRILELRLPEETLTSDSVESFRIEPADGGGGAVVTYSVGDRREVREQIAVPVRAADGGAIDLSGRTGRVRLVLRLVADPGRGQVVEVTVG